MLGIYYVHPKLRNFLVRNSIPFEKPTKNGTLLNVAGSRLEIVREEQSGRVMLSHDRHRVIELPEHAGYYVNVLTTTAELARKGDSYVTKAAKDATQNYRCNKRNGWVFTT